LKANALVKQAGAFPALFGRLVMFYLHDLINLESLCIIKILVLDAVFLS